MNADYTTLSTVASCDTKAVLRHVMGLTGNNSTEALAGQHGHSVLEAHFRGVPKSDALDHLQPYFNHCRSSGIQPGEAWCAEDLHSILSDWLDANPADNFPITPVQSELKFTVPLTSDAQYNLTGRIDLVGVIDNKLIPCDHKFRSSTSDWWLKKFNLRAQLTGYCYALKCLYDAPVSEAYINVINVPKLPAESRTKCRLHKTPYYQCRTLHVNHFLRSYVRTEAQIEPWRQTTLALMKHLKWLESCVNQEVWENVQQQGTFNDACTFCEFAIFCELGRPWPDAAKLFDYKPWNPLD